MDPEQEADLIGELNMLQRQVYRLRRQQQRARALVRRWMANPKTAPYAAELRDTLNEEDK